MEPGLLSGTEWVQRERGPTTSSKAKGASSAAHPSQSQEPLASGTRATTPRRSKQACDGGMVQNEGAAPQGRGMHGERGRQHHDTNRRAKPGSRVSVRNEQPTRLRVEPS